MAEPIFTEGQELKAEEIATRAATEGVKRAQGTCPAVKGFPDLCIKVDAMHKALLGNGEPEKGVLMRLRDVERALGVAKPRWTVWGERGWRILHGLILAALCWTLFSK